MTYKIEWWTEHAAGDLPGEYKTEKDAQAAADEWMAEMGEGHEAEVVECGEYQKEEFIMTPASIKQIVEKAPNSTSVLRSLIGEAVSKGDKVVIIGSLGHANVKGTVTSINNTSANVEIAKGRVVAVMPHMLMPL